MRRHPSHLFRSAFLVTFAGSLCLSGCEKPDARIIDSTGISPEIMSGSLTPPIVNSDTINIGPERKATDQLAYSLKIRARISHRINSDQISDVRFTFFRTKREPEITQGNLRDDGNYPDSIASDSVYTGSVEFTAPRSEIGMFYADIVASDGQGFESNTIRLPFTILRLNQPPVLSNFTAPDTVYPNIQESFVITVRATDPDGQTDIVSVTRTTPSNNVYPLNDMGVNGDTAAGDSVYTETVSLSPAPTPGTYIFTFRAIDRSNAVSGIITKTIVVAQ